MQFSFPFFPSNLHFWYEGHCLWNRFLHTYILISCILSQESHFQLQNFRNCILLGFRDILRCWEVFQCLQEDVFKPGKANYLSFKSWRWHHGAHIFASAGLASWMNSEFPQENIFRTESQRRVQCLVCCVFALYVCFVFVLSICNLCFRVVLFCASFLCLYLLFTLCFFLVSVHCICIQHSYWCSCLFMFCDCDLCGVFVHSVRSFCLCMFVLCACLCFVLAICICFVFVICALWLFLLSIYTLCMSFVFLPCVCACTVSFAVARFVALAGSFGA